VSLEISVPAIGWHKFALARDACVSAAVMPSALDLKFCADRTCLRRSGGFAPVSLPLFQETRLRLVLSINAATKT
jgi:hypothetical protein